MAPGKVIEASPIGGIDVTLNFLYTEMADEVKQRLKQPEISSGLRLQDNAEPNQVTVKCDHWVNVDQLQRHTKAVASALLNKSYKKSEKK